AGCTDRRYRRFINPACATGNDADLSKNIVGEDGGSSQRAVASHSFTSPYNVALVPSVFSKATSTLLPSKARIQSCVSLRPSIRRSNANLRPSSQRPLDALIP